MKYLHSGYVLLCDQAQHQKDGRIDALGLFDLVAGAVLPLILKCYCVIGFGTPYERRQYKGTFTLEDPTGFVVSNHVFNANDPNDLMRGHYIFPLALSLTKEGSYTARVILKNWKEEVVWEISRQFWAMVVSDQ